MKELLIIGAVMWLLSKTKKTAKHDYTNIWKPADHDPFGTVLDLPVLQEEVDEPVPEYVPDEIKYATPSDNHRYEDYLECREHGTIWKLHIIFYDRLRWAENAQTDKVRVTYADGYTSPEYSVYDSDLKEIIEVALFDNAQITWEEI